MNLFLFEHICRHFWVGATANPPIGHNGWLEMGNWPEVHSESMTCYEIHIFTISHFELFSFIFWKN